VRLAADELLTHQLVYAGVLLQGQQPTEQDLQGGSAAARGLKRGLLFGLGPACVQLLIVFPYKAEKGMAGLALGEMTPLVVVFVNLVWGVVAAVAYHLMWKKTAS